MSTETAQKQRKKNLKGTDAMNSEEVKIRVRETVKKRLNKKMKIFLEAYKANLGNISASAETAGIDRSTFYAWSKANPTFKAAVHDADEMWKDRIEAVIRKKALGDQDSSMLQFLAKTKLKDRGYVERQDVNHSGSIDGKLHHTETTFENKSYAELLKIEESLKKALQPNRN